MLLLVLGLTACTGNDPAGGGDKGDDGGPGLLGSGSPSGGNGVVVGGPCATVGQTVSCWTGPDASRNVGACHDGTRTCFASGKAEVAAAGYWGPCQGQQLDCGKDGPPPDPCIAECMTKGLDAATCAALCARSGDAGTATPPDPGNNGKGIPTCTGCVPGAVAWCERPTCSGLGLQQYCSDTITETCQPDGTWGPCTETGTPYMGGCMDLGNIFGSNPCQEFFEGNCASVTTGCTGAPDGGGNGAQ